eukprot:2234121-Prorocentrum_lima.AAC.1
MSFVSSRGGSGMQRLWHVVLLCAFPGLGGGLRPRIAQGVHGLERLWCSMWHSWEMVQEPK